MKTDPTERDQQIAREKAHEFLGAYHPNTEGRKRELESIILAAIQDAKQQGNETPTVILGFASWKDGSFELIVRDDEQGEETTLKGRLEQGQFEQVSKILPTCVFVPARCQQGNEDTARALKRFGQHAVNCGDDGKCTCGLDAAIDAARGVQPAAKDSNEALGAEMCEKDGRHQCRFCGDVWHTKFPAAQQESAPAAEQPLICSACLFDTGTCPSCGTHWVREGEKRTGYRRVK